MQEPADSDLLRQYAENDSESAFAALVTRHVNLVYSAAFRKTGNSHAAEEITQAVFIILAKKARTLRKETVLAGWLYEAARLTSANFLRTEIRRTHREQEAGMQSLTDEPEVWPQIVPLLEDAMGRLKEKERNAIVQRFFEGKSFREIGTACGGSENAAKKRVAYALEKLRKIFRKRGVESTPDAIGGAISANSVFIAPAGLAKTISAAALAKGAVASVSTLTLAHGALKLMAWTKTKTIIIGSVIALLAVGTGTVVISAVNASRSAAALATMQGSWEGTMDVGPAKLRIVLNIFKTNDTYRASLDSPDQGAMGLPVPVLSARPNSIHAALPAIDSDFQAVLSADGTEMDGKWKQLNKSYPLTLKKTAAPDSFAAMTADDYAPRADSDLQGEWSGALKVGKATLHLNLMVSEPTAGTFRAQLDSVDQGAMHLPITSMTYQKPQVHFEMSAIDAAFDGNLDSQGEVAGTWTQMRKKYPLTFARAQTNAEAATDSEKDYGSGASYQVQGHWKGVLNAGGTQLHIIIHIALMPDGSFSATMDSPDQGAYGLVASAADCAFPNAKLVWKAIGGTFAGKMEDGKLSGTWRQGKASFPLNLEKTTAQ